MDPESSISSQLVEGAAESYFPERKVSYLSKDWWKIKPSLDFTQNG